MHFLLKVSRPRFWFYIFGPYLVGLVAAAETRGDLLDWRFALFGLYFLLPANLLIYGVNDIFDYETDKLNEKKNAYETLVVPDRRKSLTIAILTTNIPFIIASIIFASAALPSLVGFLFFSIFYSAPPIRAKTKPFLDSAFNILYVFPGAFAYQMISGSFPPITLMIAAGCWTAAMHAYSAIPDIEADNKATGFKTIATVLGPVWNARRLCHSLRRRNHLVRIPRYGKRFARLCIYIVDARLGSASYRSGSLFKLYRAFPLINILAGFVIFGKSPYKNSFKLPPASAGG